MLFLALRYKDSWQDKFISLSYAEKILKRFKTYSSGTSKTHVDSQLHLTMDVGETVSQVEYVRLIRSLIYLTKYTRPDLAYEVNVLSQYTSIPHHTH